MQVQKIVKLSNNKKSNYDKNSNSKDKYFGKKDSNKSKSNKSNNVKIIKLSDDKLNKKSKLNLPKLDSSELNFRAPAEFLSLKDLKNKLVNYEQVNFSDIGNLPNGSRISYFEVMNIDGEKKFKYKVGGNIIKNGFPKYLYLTNGRNNWPVQLENHIIFKLNTEDIKEKYEKIIRKLKMENQLLKSENKKLYKELKFYNKN